jgi:hypothetical protein
VELSADGSYASSQMIGICLSIVFTLRMRKDATLYGRAPRRRKESVGDPGLKEKKLPKPDVIARTAKFRERTALVLGEKCEAHIHLL